MVFITIALNLLLIPRWGVVGAAAATSLSTVLVNVVCLLEVWILLHMQPYNRNFLKPLLAGLLSAALTAIIIGRISIPPLLELVFGVTVLWGSYLLLLLVMKLPREDILIVDRARARSKLGILTSRRAGG